jgi:hypothetical protein
MSREIALFAAHCAINVGKCGARRGVGKFRWRDRSGDHGMELGLRPAAIAAACTILAVLSACAAPEGSATATVTTVDAPSVISSAHAPRASLIKDLAGLRPADVVSILGPPDLRSDEPPAELWQYRAADCVLNLFFYSEAGGYRLVRAEAWQRTLTAGSVPARCHDEDAPIKAHLVSRSSL